MSKTSGTKAELLEEIRTNGAWKAYLASLEIVQDPQATKRERVQAASNILRAGGFFGANGEDGAGKEPHEMTAEEIRRAIIRAQSPQDPSVFD